MHNERVNVPGLPPGFTMPHTLCVTCKVGRIYSGRFKNCAECRDKNREKSHLAAQRKRQRASLAMFPSQSPTYDDPMLDIPPPAPKKAPPTKPFRDLGNDEKRLALARMKNRLPTRVREKKSASPVGSSSKAQDGKEYQTAQEMYASITRRMGRIIGTQKMLNFKGHFAIVADESIPNEKRVLLVSGYLHGTLQIPFERAQAKGKYNADRTARTLQFECTCLGYEKVAPVMKGNAGDLIKKARLSLGKVTSKPRICGGKVIVTAALDTTHPLDVLGQRIIVHVEH